MNFYRSIDVQKKSQLCFFIEKIEFENIFGFQNGISL